MRKSIQSLLDRRRLSMHELVHHTFHSKLLSTLRRPSFAGTGLPERMRSVSFALLGLTAAAGLALVAIFAQLSFPVLSPAPLPAEPTGSESISGARRLPLGRTPVAVLPAQPAHLQAQQARAVTEAPTEDRSPSAGGSDGGNHAAPAGVDTPAPASEPEPSGGSGGAGAGGNNGGGGTGGETGGGSDQAPTSAPAQPTTVPSAPAPSPHPTNPKPEAIASAPKPEPAPGPGNSSSAAAAEHASERGIEASAGAGPPASTAAPGPEAAASPGNGKGLAKGHDK